MKKKYLVYGVGVVMAFSLVACGSQTQEPDQPVVQQSEVTPQAKEIKEETPVEQDREEELHELTQEELIPIFEIACSTYTGFAAGVSTDHLIEMELHVITYLVPSGQKLPSDYEDQYRTWRPVDTQESVQQSQPASTPANSSNSTSTASTGTTGTNGTSGSSGKSGGSSGDGGRIIEEDGGGTYGGFTFDDPADVYEGIDPNRDPWESTIGARVVYGGSGG